MSYRPASSPIGSARIGRKTQLTLEPLQVDADEGVPVIFIGTLSEASGPNVGKPIMGKTIHFLVDDVEVSHAETDNNGVFSILWTWTGIGNCTSQAKYAGD